jgi:hypothetical protein
MEGMRKPLEHYLAWGCLAPPMPTVGDPILVAIFALGSATSGEALERPAVPMKKPPS